MPKGQIINSAFYTEVTGRLWKHISRVRPQFRTEGTLFLLHNNAPSHSALVVKKFPGKHGVLELSHPPCSPDLSPADFFLFPMVKTEPKERDFQGAKYIKGNVTAELNSVI